MKKNIKLSFLNVTDVAKKGMFDVNSNGVIDEVENIAIDNEVENSMFYGNKSGIIGFHKLLLDNSIEDQFDIDNPIINQILSYMGGKWRNKTITIDYNSITDKPVLHQTAISADYRELEDTPTIPSKIQELDDVGLLNPLDGDILTYEDGTWTNTKVQLSDGILDVVRDGKSYIRGGNEWKKYPSPFSIGNDNLILDDSGDIEIPSTPYEYIKIEIEGGEFYVPTFTEKDNIEEFPIILDSSYKEYGTDLTNDESYIYYENSYGYVKSELFPEYKPSKIGFWVMVEEVEGSEQLEAKYQLYYTMNDGNFNTLYRTLGDVDFFFVEGEGLYINDGSGNVLKYSDWNILEDAIAAVYDRVENCIKYYTSRDTVVPISVIEDIHLVPEALFISVKITEKGTLNYQTSTVSTRKAFELNNVVNIFPELGKSGGSGLVFETSGYYGLMLQSNQTSELSEDRRTAYPINYADYYHILDTAVNTKTPTESRSLKLEISPDLYGIGLDGDLMLFILNRDLSEELSQDVISDPHGFNIVLLKYGSGCGLGITDTGQTFPLVIPNDQEFITIPDDIISVVEIVFHNNSGDMSMDIIAYDSNENVLGSILSIEMPAYNVIDDLQFLLVSLSSVSAVEDKNDIYIKLSDINTGISDLEAYEFVPKEIFAPVLERTSRDTVRNTTEGNSYGWTEFEGEWWYVVKNNMELYSILNTNDFSTGYSDVTMMEETHTIDPNRLVTTRITNMEYLFEDKDFNLPISNWDVSNVINMSNMFYNAYEFNQDISNWDVSNVTRLYETFKGASSFNQPLNTWDVSNVTDLWGIFNGATSFNQPLNNWDVSKVEYFSEVFKGASSFNQPLYNWDVSSAISMYSMFSSATSFNQDLSGWCVANIGTIPTNFDYEATNWILPNSRPVWGTCPPP